MVSPRSYCAASSSSSSDSRSSAGNISTSLMASRSALMPKYNMPQYDVTPIARTWLCSSGGTAYVSNNFAPATYICDCGPGTLVISRLKTRAEYLVATLMPIACRVGGANPDSVTMVRASTRVVEVEWLSVACEICDSRTTGLPSPTGRSTRNGDTSLTACPGPALSSSASGYTDMGAIARTVDVGG